MTGMLSGGVERKSSEGAQAGVRVAPWWVYLCLVVVGVGYDWYCAFKWFSGKYPYWSDPVLRGQSEVAGGCTDLFRGVIGTLRFHVYWAGWWMARSAEIERQQ